MKITVVGASGLIGTKVVGALEAEGHDVVASSRSSGVDVLTEKVWPVPLPAPTCSST